MEMVELRSLASQIGSHVKFESIADEHNPNDGLCPGFGLYCLSHSDLGMVDGMLGIC